MCVWGGESAGRVVDLCMFRSNLVNYTCLFVEGAMMMFGTMLFDLQEVWHKGTKLLW